MEKLEQCIEKCWQCRHFCQKTLFNHCLYEGGEHIKPEQVKLMIDCIQICQIAADFMVRNSENHHLICKMCAIICMKCAQSCAQISEPEMQKCSEVCLECAKICKDMSEN